MQCHSHCVGCVYYCSLCCKRAWQPQENCIGGGRLAAKWLKWGRMGATVNLHPAPAGLSLLQHSQRHSRPGTRSLGRCAGFEQRAALERGPAPYVGGQCMLLLRSMIQVSALS